MGIVNVNSNYSLVLGDDVILCDTSLNPITLTLPATHPLGKRYIVKHVGGDASVNSVSIAPTGDTVDGEASFELGITKASVIVHSDGANWYIM